MSESEDSIDSIELEHSMLVEEYKELLKELNTLEKENQVKPVQQELTIEDFEMQWQQLLANKKQLEDKINEVHYQQMLKQQELEDSQDKLLLIKEQQQKQNKELQEKEQLVKLLSRELKEM